VPLDPEYPRNRLAFMLDDLRQGQPAPVLVTHEWLVERLPGNEEARRPIFLGDSGEMDDLDDDLPGYVSVPVDPDDLAYLIYTSGSTGRPKGVALPHRALSNLLAWHLGTLAGGVPILGFASLSFDVSFYEMFLAWSSGGTLVLAGEDERRDPAALDLLLRSERVEKAVLPVVVLQQLAAEWDRQGGPPPELGEITTTGERLQITPAVRDLFQRSGGEARLHNHYGPAETHVATAWTLDPDPAAWDGFPPIGRPIANTTIHLLDAWGRPAPPGAAGDLHIGGVCLARGYFGRPDLTAERFVPDAFAVSAGAPGGGRLYRTGDRARLRPDGAIEYQGRFDHQVKIRGFRVEPGEIEVALARHPAVAEAVVLPRDGKLVAYVVPRGNAAPDPGSLADALWEVVPSFMVPAAFVLLPSLPLNRNGKVDRRALPAPDAAATLEAGESGRRVAPRTPAEEVVVAAWGEALGIDPAAISVHDDFFRLGGHSLLATRVVSRLRASFGVEVAVRVVFEASTVEALARRVEELSREGRGVAPPPILPLPRPAPGGPPSEAPLSFAQEWMWLADRLDPGGSAYLSPMPVRLRGRLDVPVLERSIHEVVRRHEMLRTTFPVSGSGPVQRVVPALELELPMVDLQQVPRGEEEAARLLTVELRLLLDLERGPLLRLLLLRLGPEEHHLLLTAHHILFDGWSNGLLLAEVAALYGAFSRGEPSPLPELPIQYADFASWQRGWLQGETLERLLGYWRRELEGELPVLRLPGARGAAVTLRSARQTVELGMELSAAIQAFARSRGTTVFAVLLAALQAHLHRLSGQDDILVGTPVAGRTRPEVEKLIGYFVNTLVMRGRLGGDPTFGDLLAQVWETALGAWAHQDLPFTRLVAELRPDRAASRTPLFQVLFLLQNAPMPAAALPGLEMEGVNADVPIATFDLALSLKETPFGIAGWFFYNRDLFEPDAVARLAEGYRRLLEEALSAPERRLSELPVTGIAAAAAPVAGPQGAAAEEPAVPEPSGSRVADLSPEQRALLMLRLRRKARGEEAEVAEVAEVAVAASDRDNHGR
ncbi:MAG TPA: amino acid adenylation domain-containing protein, partial [Thermoanaerobaculia bacterium]|nr:amino acid adenylation domain-containing protein [Thermoanaerobaculia bacterium]